MYIRLIIVRTLCHLPGMSNTSFGIYIYAYTCSMYINIHTKTVYIPIYTYTLVCVYAYVQICTYVYLHVYVHVFICMHICYTWFRIGCVWDKSSFFKHKIFKDTAFIIDTYCWLVGRCIKLRVSGLDTLWPFMSYRPWRMMFYVVRGSVEQLEIS